MVQFSNPKSLEEKKKSKKKKKDKKKAVRVTT